MNTTDFQFPPPASSPRMPASWFNRAIWIVSGLYLAAVILACVLIRVESDTWWVATLLMLGPRWIAILPAGLLLPIAAVFSRRSLWLLGAAVVVALFPLMGLCVHLPSGGAAGLPSIRILTCNVHAWGFDRKKLAAEIETNRVNVVALEEWPFADSDPIEKGRDWHQMSAGDLHVESRFPLRIPLSLFRSTEFGWGDAASFEVQTPAGWTPLIVTHLLSPHGVISYIVHSDIHSGKFLAPNNRLREEQADLLAGAAAHAGEAVIVAGDFNMTADSWGFSHDFGFLGDAFSQAGNGFGWTYWWRGTAVRIDHVLYGKAWRCTACWVTDTIGSPHRPTIAELRQR